MKDEVPYLKKLTNRLFDWDGMEVKKMYKNQNPKRNNNNTKKKMNLRQQMNLEEIIDDNNDGIKSIIPCRQHGNMFPTSLEKQGNATVRCTEQDERAVVVVHYVISIHMSCT